MVQKIRRRVEDTENEAWGGSLDTYVLSLSSIFFPPFPRDELASAMDNFRCHEA